jgi:RimJ/RimL family protein N-acetyltransferase
MKWPPDDKPLVGSTVTLEPLRHAHEKPLLEVSREAEIWTWIDRTVPESDENFGRWFGERLAAKSAASEWPFATISNGTGDAIGSSSYLSVRTEHDGLEIGWTWLHPSAWRGGANVEAKLLMLACAFEELGCMRVEFKTDARNERSRGALEAVPATFEGIFRQHMLMPGIGVRDSAYFSIVDEDWPDVKANLQRRLETVRAV